MASDEPKRGLWGKLFGALLALLVLGAGMAIAIRLVQTSPHAKQRTPAREARLVEVQEAQFADQRAEVDAMGTVQAAREVAIQPQVSGQIIKVGDELVPGGRFQEGGMLVQIDPADYKLALEQRRSEVSQARTELALELGQQTVAQREYEMLGETIKEEDRALVLRQPQLERVRSRLQSAEAALALAQLHLDRTTVCAPFNAVVRERRANLGMQVTTATTLAVLTGTDAYWVEVTVPVDQLRWIELPGARARIFNEAAWGATAHRVGKVIRLLSDLEQQGRMARLLVEVADPLDLRKENANQPKLLLGDYVRIKIEGVELKNVAMVDRRLVREGNNVWVMNDRNQLEIRPVQIVFRARDKLFIRDSLRPGERLVVTELSAAVDGMLLRTTDNRVENKQER